MPCQREPGNDARDPVRATARPRDGSLRSSRQETGGAPRDARERPARARVPFTTGILIGIGETFDERIDALLAIRELARTARSHPRSDRPELPSQARHPHGGPSGAGASTTCCSRSPWPVWSWGRRSAIQAPPNLTPDEYGTYLGAGLSDWGGVSPVTPDHVNPEAPWPKLDELRAVTEGARVHADGATGGLSGLLRGPRRTWSGGSTRRSAARSSTRSTPRATGARTKEWFSGVEEPPPASAYRVIGAARTGRGVCRVASLVRR